MKLTLENAMYLTVMIACCIVTAVVLLRPPKLTLTAAPYKPGEVVGSVENVDYGKANKTLLIVVRSGCEFCSASMPFYRRLAETTRDRNDVRVLIVTRDDTLVAGRYLGGYQLQLPVVTSIDVSRALNIAATPTLILVNRTGTVKNVWVGQLSSGREKEVIRELFKS